MTDLLDVHDVLLADLDGTLYQGPVAVPGAVEAVLGAAERGVRTVYITNNASRSPSDVAEHLAELGFPAGPDDVVASSHAAATMLAEQLPAGARVLVVGTDALAAAVTGVGLSVAERADDADAVVQGHSPDTGLAVAGRGDGRAARRGGLGRVQPRSDPAHRTRPDAGQRVDGHRSAHVVGTGAAGRRETCSRAAARRRPAVRELGRR